MHIRRPSFRERLIGMGLCDHRTMPRLFLPAKSVFFTFNVNPRRAASFFRPLTGSCRSRS